MNSCGGCGACCEVLPVRELKLTGFTRCPHLRGAFDAKGIGCSIYAQRPYSCQSWKCGWLKSDWPAEFRPDRIGLIVDENLDLIRINGVEVPSTEIWVMPGHEDDFEHSDVANTLIMASIDKGLAVLWRMKDGTAITFCRIPKTGKLARSAPQQPAAEGTHSLGSVGERLWKAEQMMRAKKDDA